MTNTKTNTLLSDAEFTPIRDKLIKLKPRKKGQGRDVFIKKNFEFYVKTGILDYWRNKIVKKYQIPKLNSKTDLEEIQIPIFTQTNPYQQGYYYNLQSKWYYQLPTYKKELLDKEIKSIINQLYMPRESFDMFLNYFLFKKLFNNPIRDDEIIADIANGTYPDDITLGYTVDEIRAIQNRTLMVLCLKREYGRKDYHTDDDWEKEQKWIDKQIEYVPQRCSELIKKLKRAKRPTQRLRRNIQIVNYMRKSKQGYSQTFFVTSKSGYLKKKKKRNTMTATDIASKMYASTFSLEKSKNQGKKISQQFRRLKKTFPFLEDFVNS